MVTVPRIVTPSVAPQPLAPGYRSAAGATADIFGASRAQSLQQGGAQLQNAGAAVAQLALREQIEDNERTAKNLDIELTTRMRALETGDGTAANPGFYNLKGEAALAARENVKAEMTKLQAELMAQAPNQRVKDMFGLTAKARINDATGRINQYTGEQRLAANKTTAEARIEEAKQQAAAGWNDPKQMAAALGVAGSEAQSIAEQDGLSPEAALSKVQEAQTQVIHSAIVAAIQTDPMAAHGLYVQYGFMMDGTARTDIEKMLNTATLAAQSQKTSDALIAKHGRTLAGWDAALAEAATITHAQLRDETVARLDDFYQRIERKVDRAERKEDRAEAAMDRAERRADRLEDRKFRDEERARDEADRARVTVARDATNTIVLNSVDEAESKAAVAKIGDPLLQADVNKLVEDYWVDRRRMEDEALAKVAPGLAATIVTPATSKEQEAAQVRAIRDVKLQKSVGEEVQRLQAEEDRIAKDNLKKQVGDYHIRLQNGETVAQIQQSDPVAFQAIMAEPDVHKNMMDAQKLYASGKRNASVSDATTMNTLRGMSVAERAQADLSTFQHLLTPSEETSAVSMIESAKQQVEKVGENTAVYTQGEAMLRKVAPKFLAKNWNGAKETEENTRLRQEATSDFNAWVYDNFTSQGKLPTAAEMEKKAVELMVPLTGRTGAIFGSSINTIAADLENLSEGERENVMVPIEAISPQQRANVESIYQRHGIRKPSDHQIEAYMGAHLAQDQARKNRLLGVK